MPKEKNTAPMCPQCGSDQYTVNHAGGSTTTFLMCKSCGKKGTQEAWTKQKQIMHNNGDSFDLKAFNLSKIKLAATSVGDNNQLASDKPAPENDPTLTPKRNRGNEKRTNPVDRIRDRRYDSEHVKAESSGDNKKMAFNLKKLKASKTNHECNCLSKHAHVDHKDMCDDCKVESNKIANKPFNMMKIAREFRYTEEQLERKELNKNTVFPEGRQDIKSKDSKGKGNSDEKYIGVDENRRFDTVDRKDAHTPDPKQFIPGYESWYNREVDKYYDGWLDDHIENSGGKVVGSNTEKTMNLNDKERYHAPKYPTEASYEKLLESRHSFDDDYKRKVAFNLGKIKKAQSYDLNDLRNENISPQQKDNAIPKDHKYTGEQNDEYARLFSESYKLNLIYNELMHKYKEPLLKEFWDGWTTVPLGVWYDLKDKYRDVFEKNKKIDDDLDRDDSFKGNYNERISFNLSKLNTSKKKI